MTEPSTTEHPTEWSAVFIAPDDDFHGAPLLRREFTLDTGHGKVRRAILRVSAHGIFEAFLGGCRVDDDVLSPGWTSYEWRLRYREYDVTELVRDTDVLGLALGNGWYRGRLGWTGSRAVYGEELAGLAQLDITFADGHLQRVVTDDKWWAGPSDTLANDLYDGQVIDARRRDESWLQPAAELSGWTGVHTVAADPGRLEPFLAPPVRRQETLRPVDVSTSPSGRPLVDFGQNLVGWVRLRVAGAAGARVVLRHAEVLEHGELGVRPLRSARATDEFVLSGGEDLFEPTRTFHGFRYVEVEGWPGGSLAESVEAVVVHSDLPRIGHFSCSDPLLQRFHDNVVWGLKGNMVDIPTDCPQRDERLGWTGDLAVFAPTAAFLYDVRGFLRDWLRDLAAEQAARDGLVPFVVPDVLKYEEVSATVQPPESTAIWGDVAVWAPWALWQAYGDPADLADHYPAMAAHVRRVEGLLSGSGLWEHGFQFGDWLDPQAPPDDPFRARADPAVVATACLHRSARMVAEAAALLGRPEDAAGFTSLADGVRAAFQEEYVDEDCRVRSDCPTVYALAIVFGLLESAQLGKAGQRLAGLVRANEHRVATGFAGTPYVCDALTQTGHVDVAYRLLLERECPSWLYPVTMGATTVWERWDSMRPDGSLNPGEMTSFNHYAFGAVADWMHRTIGGLAPLEPGYARVLVAPRPGGGITWARTTLDTPRGTVAVIWKVAGETIELTVDVPDGTTAVIRPPAGSDVEVGAGHHRLTTAATAVVA